MPLAKRRKLRAAVCHVEARELTLIQSVVGMVVALKLHSLSIFEVAKEEIAWTVVHVLSCHVGHSKFHPVVRVSLS